MTILREDGSSDQDVFPVTVGSDQCLLGLQGVSGYTGLEHAVTRDSTRNLTRRLYP